MFKWILIIAVCGFLLFEYVLPTIDDAITGGDNDKYGSVVSSDEVEDMADKANVDVIKTKKLKVENTEHVSIWDKIQDTIDSWFEEEEQPEEIYINR